MTRSFSKAALSLATALAAGCFIRVDIYTDAGAGSASGTGGAGGSGGACTPGETRPCYDGPDGTEGKGICKAGVQTCFPDGSSWFSCSGAVKPAVENCATPEDEDCDGLAPACKGLTRWAVRAGDISADRGESVAADQDGNVIVTGSFAGALDFSGCPATSAGGRDAFVTKLDAQGACLWTKSAGDVGDDEGVSITVGNDGSVVVVGAFSGTIDFGGLPVTSIAAQDVFIAKLDSDGNALWVRSAGSEALVGSVAIDDDDNVIVAGDFSGIIDFGGCPAISAGGWDAFVTKLDAFGSCLWNKAYGDATDNFVAKSVSVTADGQGNLLLAGGLYGSLDLGGCPMTSAGAMDVFVAKLSAAGGCMWAKQAGDSGSQAAMSVRAIAASDMVIAGGFSGVLDLFGCKLTSVGGQDMFVARLDAAGTCVWAKRAGDFHDQIASALAVDSGGNISIAGHFGGELDLGGGALAASGELDAFIAKLDASGGYQWARRGGSAGGYALAWGVAADPAGNLLITGLFSGTTDFGTGPLTSKGSDDIFVLSVTP